jgi:tetratricopeptide (TPR) repeat protein
MARADVWVTGEDGFVMRFDGKAWSAAQPTWPRIQDLAPVSAHELWAVNGEMILHWAAPALRPAAKLSQDLWNQAKPTPSQERLDDAARERLARYRERLGAGRAATKAAKYELAASAFTAALEAKPGDARAYSERGYAAYLAKNFDDARLDLEKAAERADERSLRAQTFFNLGLVREALGRDGTSAFALSNFLHSTRAAKERLVGKNACAVEVDRSASAIAFRKYSDWLALYDDVAWELHLDDKVSTSGAARKLLCGLWQPDPPKSKGDACSGPAPWVITNHAKSSFVVAQAPDGLFAAMASSVDRAMFCPDGASAEIVYRGPAIVVLRAFGGTGTDVLACDDDGHECTQEDEADLERDPESHSWVHGCNWQGYEKYEVVDLAKRTFPLIVTQFDESNRSAKESEQVQIGVDARGIALKGPGCDDLLPLPGGG